MQAPLPTSVIQSLDLILLYCPLLEMCLTRAFNYSFSSLLASSERCFLGGALCCRTMKKMLVHLLRRRCEQAARRRARCVGHVCRDTLPGITAACLLPGDHSATARTVTPVIMAVGFTPSLFIYTGYREKAKVLRIYIWGGRGLRYTLLCLL